jgi:hypothetical protein
VHNVLVVFWKGTQSILTGSTAHPTQEEAYALCSHDAHGDQPLTPWHRIQARGHSSTMGHHAPPSVTRSTSHPDSTPRGFSVAHKPTRVTRSPNRLRQHRTPRLLSHKAHISLLQQGHLWFAGNVVPVGQEDMGKKKSGQQRGQFHNVVQIYRTM